MTKQQSLGELKTLATPALRHVELVHLARRESPNGADKVASQLGWPRRQVKAVRSLAILRRDYGLEAFEAFVVEHARSDQTDTGHAQKEKVTMERILKSVGRLVEAVQKLIVLLLHGFKEEAWAYISELVENGEAAFWRGNSRNTVIQPDGRQTENDCLTLCLSSKKLDCKDRCHFEKYIKLNFTALAASGYDNERVVGLVRKVVEETLALGGKVSGHYWWVAIGTTQACKDFLPPDDELTKRSIIQQFRWLGEDFEFWRMRDHLDSQFQKESSLDVVIEAVYAKLLELGMTAEQVRTLYTQWLQERQGTYFDYLHALASCWVFKGHESERDAAVHVHLPEYWMQLVKSQISAQQFRGLKKFGLYSVEDSQFFRTQLVQLLSEGNATQCFELLVIFNLELGFGDLKQYADRDQIRRWARKMLDELAHDAFDAACKECRFGTAAALTQHFDCVNEAQLKTAANLHVENRLNEVDVSINDEDYTLDENVDHLFSHLEETDATHDCSVLWMLKAERDEHLAASIATRRQEVKQATQVAIDLFQPIKLNFEPNWAAK